MIKLQNLRFPEKEICQTEELYFHRNPGKLILDGYFNLLYLEKRKKYTNLEGLALRLAAPGYRQLNVCCDRKVVQSFTLDPAEKTVQEFVLPYKRLTGNVLYLELVEGDKTQAVAKNSGGDPVMSGINGAFFGLIPENKVHPVHVGIDICTFRRETYVLRNLKQMTERLLDREDEEAGRHFRLWVIDNGQTLDKYEPLQKYLKELAYPEDTDEEREGNRDIRDRVRIIPNKNSGGAGGFTRGMVEILNEKERLGLTHVLLMDDDAVVDPETMVRIYGFISTLKDSWKDVTVGGAMFREEIPYILFCSGEWWEKGRIQNTALNWDLRSYKMAASRELAAAEHEKDRYSGWWCCCYSLNTVREDNLPLPLFLHHDDIEFGLRNSGQGAVFLNGVGVWHRTPTESFPGPTGYYDVRNNLIEIALHGNGGLKLYRIIMLKAILGWALKHYYTGSLLAYYGMIDFLKGPQWLYRTDAEQLNNYLRNSVPKLKPLEELKNELTEAEFTSLSAEIEEIRTGGSAALKAREQKPSLKHILTMNGWLLPTDGEASLLLSTDAPYRNYRKEKVLLYEMGSGKGLVRKRNWKEMARILKLLIRAMIAVSTEVPGAEAKWRSALPELTSKASWKRYLGLDTGK